MVLAVESTNILATNLSKVYLQSCLYVQFEIPLVTALPGKGGTPHMKGVGMLVGNFELKGDGSGRGPRFFFKP